MGLLCATGYLVQTTPRVKAPVRMTLKSDTESGIKALEARILESPKQIGARRTVRVLPDQQVIKSVSIDISRGRY